MKPQLGLLTALMSLLAATTTAEEKYERGTKLMVVVEKAEVRSAANAESALATTLAARTIVIFASQHEQWIEISSPHRGWIDAKAVRSESEVIAAYKEQHRGDKASCQLCSHLHEI